MLEIGSGILAVGLAATLAFGMTLGRSGDDPAGDQGASASKANATAQGKETAMKTKTATFGGGCFWCTEAVFEEMNGVSDVVSGYAGGRVKSPTYQEVCAGTTGHAEVVQITYDPEVISYPELLEVFWKTHDPTTLNRQGNDVGPQYRSIILYEDDDQKQEAEAYKARLNEAGAFERPVVTEVVPLTTFYRAEETHQDYYRKNPTQGYCQFVIGPKMEKFRKVFQEKLKD